MRKRCKTELDMLLPPRLLTLKNGTDFQLEDDADRLLVKGSDGKPDYLSRGQLALRRAREVSNSYGSADGHLMSGLYRRAYNPTMGHRPTKPHHNDDWEG